VAELSTGKQITWCSGCGNFGILNAFKQSVLHLLEEGIRQEDIVVTCGIGCHGKIFDYLQLSGMYCLHGRALVTAEGIKLANPELKVISFGGDGDSLGEGLEHTLFAAKRNFDLTLILHNNGNYGLTTGQFSPLSNAGYKGLSTPRGNIEQPFNAVTLLMEAGASFVARGYSVRIDHLSGLIRQAIHHKGFSFIEVLQPCVTYNNTYQYLNQRIKLLETVPVKEQQARELARSEEETYIGVFRQTDLPVYHDLLYNDTNPCRNRLNSTQRKARGLL